MSYIYLKASEEAAKLVSAIEVSGKRLHPSEMHITVLYLGKEIPIEKALPLIQSVCSVVDGFGYFDVKLSKIDSFPEGADGIPVIAHIDSSKLVELNDKLRKALDKIGFEYPKKFPEYKPHLTLSYSDTKVDKIKLPRSIGWTVSEVHLATGSSDNNLLDVTIPLTLLSKKESHFVILDSAMQIFASLSS